MSQLVMSIRILDVIASSGHYFLVLASDVWTFPWGLLIVSGWRLSYTCALLTVLPYCQYRRAAAYLPFSSFHIWKESNWIKINLIALHPFLALKEEQKEEEKEKKGAGVAGKTWRTLICPSGPHHTRVSVVSYTVITVIICSESLFVWLYRWTYTFPDVAYM